MGNDAPLSLVHADLDISFSSSQRFKAKFTLQWFLSIVLADSIFFSTSVICLIHTTIFNPYESSEILLHRSLLIGVSDFVRRYARQYPLVTKTILFCRSKVRRKTQQAEDLISLLSNIHDSRKGVSQSKLSDRLFQSPFFVPLLVVVLCFFFIHLSLFSLFPCWTVFFVSNSASDEPTIYYMNTFLNPSLSTILTTSTDSY